MYITIRVRQQNKDVKILQSNQKMHTRNSDNNAQLVGAFETRLEDTVNLLTSNVFFPSTAPPSIEGRCGARPNQIQLDFTNMTQIQIQTLLNAVQHNSK